MPMTTVVIGLMLGFGALQELFVRGIWNGEGQPLVVGAAGAVVSALLLLAALAMWRGWSAWPRTAALAGVLSVVFHTYAAFGPERYVGNFALLAHALRSRAPRLHVE